MAQFIVYARRPDDSVVKLRYDNETSDLTWVATGQPVITGPRVATNWGTAAVISKQEPGHKADVKMLKISLGLSCNYACTYCSQRFVPHNSTIGLNDIEPFVRKLPTWFDIAGEDGQGGGRHIEFWGGEPLVYIKTLRPLADALRAMMPNARFSMITNGSLLTLDLNEWLDHTGFKIGISHDGPGQHVRGPDPFDDPLVFAAIHDLYTRLHPKNRITFNTMLHRDNRDRGAIQAWFRARFGDNVALGEGSFVDPYDAGGMASMLQADEHHAFRLQAFRDLRNGTAVNFGIAFQKPMDFIDSIRKRRPASSLGQKCGMDRADTVATTLKGEIVTCQNVSPISKAPNGERHRIGHVENLSEARLTTATHWRNRPECAACPVLQLCKGACMFLEGEHWETACDTSFSDNIPFFAAAIEYLTGAIPFRIEGPQRADRQSIWR